MNLLKVIIVRHLVAHHAATHKHPKLSHPRIESEHGSICLYNFLVIVRQKDEIEVWGMTQKAKVVLVWWY